MLLAAGHVHARSYPIATLWYEAQLVTERVNNLVSTEMVLTHAAMAAILSKESVKHFDKLLKRLRDGN